jgi:hypothetical protein
MLFSRASLLLDCLMRVLWLCRPCKQYLYNERISSLQVCIKQRCCWFELNGCSLIYLRLDLTLQMFRRGRCIDLFLLPMNRLLFQINIFIRLFISNLTFCFNLPIISYFITYFNIDIMSMFMSMFNIIFITFSYNIAISSIYMSM